MAPKPTTAQPALQGRAEDAGLRAAPGSPAANVVVLAEDDALVESLKDALDARQRIWRADDLVQAAELLLAAQSGVFFVDAGLTAGETPGLVDKLHAQFPDLPIVVAGRREDELELGQRISTGAVFRFLHKPVSAERIRNFIEAAARRAGELPRAASPLPDPAAAQASASIRLPRPRFALAAVRRAARVGGVLLLLAVSAAAVVAVVAKRPWEQFIQAPAPVPAQRAVIKAPLVRDDPELVRLLGAAGVARSQGRLAEPAGDNAIELYRSALLLDPGNTAAREGLSQTADELLLEVEKSLLAEDLAGAAAALDAARSADSSNPRLGFFSTQLQHERERILGASARAPAAGAAAAERALSEQVSRLLTLADARMKEGQLTGGAETAEVYITEARTLRPDDPGVQQALNALSWRMMLAANDAIDAGDTTTAAAWLDQAERLGVDGQAVARLRAEMESAGAVPVREDISRLVVLANQRIAQGQLLEPATDSARHYVDLLQAAAPAHERLAETRALLASRLLEAAGAESRAGRYAESERFLGAAEAAGARSQDLAAARDQLATSRALAAAATEVLPESALERTVHPPLEYPAAARARGLEGSVEIEFTVAADGTTRDPLIRAANPKGVFEATVLRAVRTWRYRPRIVAGQPVDQRVVARLRFELTGS